VKVVNKRTHWATQADVYIGRPSVLGNPYHLGPKETRGATIARYKAWLWEQIQAGGPVLDAIMDLKPEANLVCWCHPQPCHGDVIMAAYAWLKSREKQEEN